MYKLILCVLLSIFIIAARENKKDHWGVLIRNWIKTVLKISLVCPIVDKSYRFWKPPIYIYSY